MGLLLSRTVLGKTSLQLTANWVGQSDKEGFCIKGGSRGVWKKEGKSYTMLHHTTVSKSLLFQSSFYPLLAHTLSGVLQPTQQLPVLRALTCLLP